MFSFFKKKSKAPAIKDMVFSTTNAKLDALSALSRQAIPPVFVAWFEDSKEALQLRLQQQNLSSDIIDYRQVHTTNDAATIVFIEHYPLLQKEQEIFNTLKDIEIIVYSALDEPLLTYFGSERIASMLTKMGMNENEAITHPLITSAIANAQQKLAGKVTIEHSASNMKDWMRKNVGL